MLMPGALYSMYEKKKSERRSEKWDTFSFCALLRRNRLIAPTTGIRRGVDVTMACMRECRVGAAVSSAVSKTRVASFENNSSYIY